MVKINGVEATSTISLKNREATPSLNDIFDRLEKNSFDVINNIKTQSATDELSSQKNNSSPSSELANILGVSDEKNNLLFSILPTLLSKNKTNAFKDSQNILFKEIIKSSNNPKLSQLMELLPKLFSKKSSSSVIESTNVIHTQPKIDSYIKTDDYIEK